MMEVQEPNQRVSVHSLIPHLQTRGRGVSGDLSQQSENLGVSRRHFQRLLFSLAEGSHRCQYDLLIEVLKYAQALEMGGQAKPLLFTQHIKHDETPLRLNVQFALGERFAQLTKIMVVETKWSMLLESPTPEGGFSYLVLSGNFGTSIRASENASAESLAKVLHSCPSPPEDLLSSFTHRFRLVETDKCGANLRLEHMLEDAGGWPTARLHTFCSAHATHLVATKSWALLTKGKLQRRHWNYCEDYYLRRGDEICSTTQPATEDSETAAVPCLCAGS